MSKENDRIPSDIACIDIDNIPATLISTTGSHCEVWRSIGTLVRADERFTLDFVIKKSRLACSRQEVRMLYKDYQILRDRLGDMIPKAAFICTLVDGHESVVVLAETALPWFNIANPSNEEVAIPMLCQYPRIISQLEEFLQAAAEWYQDSKVIDLYGLDNLILDRNQNVRYIDSFSVFFYEDMLKLDAEETYSLKQKIDISLQRRNYLYYLLDEVKKQGFPRKRVIYKILSE